MPPPPHAEHFLQRTNPGGGGLVQPLALPPHTSTTLCANDAQPLPTRSPSPSRPLPRAPLGWVSRSRLLIGVRTKTAASEHELMEAAGRALCSRLFCLVPVQKRDAPCSANKLSAAITLYTAAPPSPDPPPFDTGGALELQRGGDRGDPSSSRRTAPAGTWR